MTFYTIVVPMRFQDNLLSITDPLSFEVWMCFLISIPSYIVAIIIMNYIYSKSTNWEEVVSIVIRGALSEDKATYIKPPNYLYQKLLVLIWSWMMLVLISAYQDNLIALITKPSINIPFTNKEGMIKQNQIKWGLADGGLFTDYAKSKDQETTLRTMYDKNIKNHGVSQINLKELENNALICDISEALSIMAKDFSKTGTCNYYLTQDQILATDSALAFQA